MGSYTQEFLILKFKSEQTVLNFGSLNDEPYNYEFSYKQLEHMLRHNIKNSSPGRDDIHPYMENNLADYGQNLIFSRREVQ